MMLKVQTKGKAQQVSDKSAYSLCELGLSILINAPTAAIYE